jgi:hypothetical protein
MFMAFRFLKVSFPRKMGAHYRRSPRSTQMPKRLAAGIFQYPERNVCELNGMNDGWNGWKNARASRLFVRAEIQSSARLLFLDAHPFSTL